MGIPSITSSTAFVIHLSAEAEVQIRKQLMTCSSCILQLNLQQFHWRCDDDLAGSCTRTRQHLSRQCQLVTKRQTEFKCYQNMQSYSEMQTDSDIFVPHIAPLVRTTIPSGNPIISSQNLLLLSRSCTLGALQNGSSYILSFWHGLYARHAAWASRCAAYLM